MSLKDRLNSTQQQNTQSQTKQEQQPKYYTSEVEANIDTLGALDTILADDDINSVFVSGAKNIYLEKKGKIHKSTTTFRDNVQLENMLKKIASNEGVEFDEYNPYFNFNHKLGINICATIPPLSNIPTLFIKCYKDKFATLQTLQEELSVSKEIGLILEALCSIKRNILIVGDKNTLKTTLLSSLAKKITSNNRVTIIDSENEFKIQGQNYTNYNFSNIANPEIERNLLNSIIDTIPDKIIINTQKDNILSDTIDLLQCGYKGVIMSVCSNNTQNAIEKLAYMYTKNHSFISFEKARALILSAFDIIITTSKDILGRRKVERISQINAANNKFIEDIFVLEYNHHNSTGIIPLFFEDIKTNSLPIGDNIFDISYKHTYHKSINLDNSIQFNRKANADILKKFKKELPAPKTKEEQEKEVEDIFKEQTKEELIQKAQEKFEEMKKIVQIQEQDKDNFEIDITQLQEDSLNENQNETL